MRRRAVRFLALVPLGEQRSGVPERHPVDGVGADQRRGERVDVVDLAVLLLLLGRLVLTDEPLADRPRQRTERELLRRLLEAGLSRTTCPLCGVDNRMMVSYVTATPGPGGLSEPA